MILLLLVNKFRSPPIIDISAGKELSAKMLSFLRSDNELSEYIRQLEDDKLIRWKNYDAKHCLFPPLTADDVRNITFGKVD